MTKVFWKVGSDFRKRRLTLSEGFVASSGYAHVDLSRLKESVRDFVFENWNLGRDTEGFVNLRTFYVYAECILEKEMVLETDSLSQAQASSLLEAMLNSYSASVAALSRKSGS